MTYEEEFEHVLLKRTRTAAQITGHSFSRLIELIKAVGGVAAARRLIAPTASNIGRFPVGMRVLARAGLLHLSVEQAVIDFGEAGKIFGPEEVREARQRLEMARMVLKRVKGSSE
ncbi:hypothetical protein BST63_18865 [Bradyrhizobium canariense]|uniref:Uncharacterized protein n=1 Tax=Bradyrhizobium canariense TaxID=255045 RepID=A0ABX3X219_9BRAD|nr:hypothetical protein [Bradyrhizobium canariense]OSJ13749.1 hypothetical protein BSR47_19750 [Bradyrhizobium canariense]OSJ27805.1 hypothetical protein BST63_18865 [Bradyrhizobium canariense]